jgi:hypothetical protein
LLVISALLRQGRKMVSSRKILFRRASAGRLTDYITMLYFFAALRRVGIALPAFKARMIPIPANIVGPPLSTTSISASTAACRSEVWCTALGSPAMYSQHRAT